MKKIILLLILTLFVSCEFDQNGLMYNATHGEKPVNNAIFYIADIDSENKVTVFSNNGVFVVEEKDFNNSQIFKKENSLIPYYSLNNVGIHQNAAQFYKANESEKYIISIADLKDVKQTTKKTVDYTVLQYSDNAQIRELSNKNKELWIDGLKVSDISTSFAFFYNKSDKTKYAYIKDSKLYDSDGDTLIYEGSLVKNINTVIKKGTSYFILVDNGNAQELSLVKTTTTLESKSKDIFASTNALINFKETFHFDDKQENTYFQAKNAESFIQISKDGSKVEVIDGYTLLNLDKNKISLAGIEITSFLIKGNKIVLGTLNNGLILAIQKP